MSLDWTRPKDPPLSLGHASILANLKAHNIDVFTKSWAVNHSSFQVDDVFNFLENLAIFHADIAIGAFVWNEQYVRKIIRYLKSRHFPGRIILGGPQISYVKSNIEIEKYYPDGDIFIRGNAEDAIVEYMLSREKYTEIQGIHYAGQVTKNESAKADLKSLPSPYLTGILQKQRFLRWETQRGCPFKCKFCQHRESDQSQKRREFHKERIVNEIDWLVQDNIVQDIAVLDPTFNSGENYLDILEQFSKLKYKGKLSLQCRIEMVKPEFLDLVQEINKTGRVVLEFGLQTIHKNEEKYIDRPNNIRKVKNVLQDTALKNIETEVSVIFGLPGQTLNSFKETIDVVKSFNVRTIHAFPLMLLRGTPLYYEKESLGLVESTDSIHTFDKIPRIQENIPHVVSSLTFTYDDWLLMGQLAEDLQTNHNSKK